jgi:hypothetical protein
MIFAARSVSPLSQNALNGGRQGEPRIGNMSRLAKVMCILVAVGLLSACGVRGKLDPPPGSTPAKKDDPFILDKII